MCVVIARRNVTPVIASPEGAWRSIPTLRHINAAARKILPHILRKIGKLQPGADRIRFFNELVLTCVQIHKPCKGKHQLPDRVCRSAAVVQHFVFGLQNRVVHILSKCRQQRECGGDGNVICIKRLTKGSADLSRHREIAMSPFGLLAMTVHQPILQCRQPRKPLVNREPPLIGQVITRAGKAVQGQHARAHGLGYQPRSDRKVFVMPPAMKRLAQALRFHGPILSTMLG